MYNHRFEIERRIILYWYLFLFIPNITYGNINVLDYYYYYYYFTYSFFFTLSFVHG